MPFIKHDPTVIERCNNPEHNPPGLIVLEPGIHTYQCPSCGEITTVNAPLVTC